MAADGETIDSAENTGSEERPVALNTKPLFKLMVDKRASDLGIPGTEASLTEEMAENLVG